jgi:hypothetical protein
MRYLAAAALVLTTAACAADGRTEARLHDYSLTSPTTLSVMVDGCRLDPTVDDLQQTAQEVRLLVRRDHPAPLGTSSCADAVTVELDAPLGDRRVVDARSGVEVQVAGG